MGEPRFGPRLKRSSDEHRVGSGIEYRPHVGASIGRYDYVVSRKIGIFAASIQGERQPYANF
jgi:hypothetical protein